MRKLSFVAVLTSIGSLTFAADAWTGTMYAPSEARPSISASDWLNGVAAEAEGPGPLFNGLQSIPSIGADGTATGLTDGAGGPGITKMVGYDFTAHVTTAFIFEDELGNWTPTPLSRIRSFCSNAGADLRVYQNFSIMYKDQPGFVPYNQWKRLFRTNENPYGVMNTADYYTFNSGQWDKSLIDVKEENGGLLVNGAMIYGLKLDYWCLGWYDQQYQPTQFQPFTWLNPSGPNFGYAQVVRPVFDEVDVFGVPGDLDFDVDVDIDDYDILAGAYGSFRGDPTYNGRADLDLDDDVDIDDYDILARFYGTIGS